ncbi:cyclin-related family protein [Striga asiatica]|uniref:Cyclin-related family protein n=1 Tax=Striga asiatica TaxID=4170 RepID=A0A5A7PVM1_STRAF|nr:cyclin-related family protein [Striga asiatica]
MRKPGHECQQWQKTEKKLRREFRRGMRIGIGFPKVGIENSWKVHFGDVGRVPVVGTGACPGMPDPINWFHLLPLDLEIPSSRRRSKSPQPLRRRWSVGLRYLLNYQSCHAEKTVAPTQDDTVLGSTASPDCFVNTASPKRSRRDVKVESERPPPETKSDRDRDSDQRHHRRLRDPLPLESPLAVNKDTDNRVNGPQESTKRTSDQTKVPQSRSYFQHDERASGGQNGRVSSYRTDKERGWWRDSENSRAEAKMPRSYLNDETSKDSRDGNHAWKHDRYFQMEADQKPPSRSKRPAFREQKAPLNPEQTEKTAEQKVQDNNVVESGKRDVNRSSARGREFGKYETWSKNGRDRYKGERDRFSNNRQGGYNQAGGGRVEKWKHDLYDEANKSPNPKNEEDQISKIEALLAS